MNESDVAIFLPRHTRSSEHNSLYVVSMLGSGIMVVAVIGFILRYPQSLDKEYLLQNLSFSPDDVPMLQVYCHKHRDLGNPERVKEVVGYRVAL